MQQITLTAEYIKELAELVGFEVKDVAVDDWLPDDLEVNLKQFDEPQEVKDEDGNVCGCWTTIAEFPDAPENGACPLGKSTPHSIGEGKE